MKILAFTDVHGSMKALREIKRKAKDVDILVDCGDMSLFGTYLERHLKFLNRIKKPVFVIHGNHETRKEMTELCKRLENITFIDRMLKSYKDVLFIGYGGGGFARRDKKFDTFAKRIKPKVKKYDKVVLITHGPPYGTRQDEIMPNEYCGNKSYRKFIMEVKPKLMLCGHIHENFNTIDKLKKTIIVNPGPLGRTIKI